MARLGSPLDDGWLTNPASMHLKSQTLRPVGCSEPKEVVKPAEVLSSRVAFKQTSCAVSTQAAEVPIGLFR